MVDNGLGKISEVHLHVRAHSLWSFLLPALWSIGEKGVLKSETGPETPAISLHNCVIWGKVFNHPKPFLWSPQIGLWYNNIKCNRICKIACFPPTATVAILVSSSIQVVTAERGHSQERLGIIARGQEVLSPQVTNGDVGSRERKNSTLVTTGVPCVNKQGLARGLSLAVNQTQLPGNVVNTESNEGINNVTLKERHLQLH